MANILLLGKILSLKKMLRPAEAWRALAIWVIVFIEENVKTCRGLESLGHLGYC